MTPDALTLFAESFRSSGHGRLQGFLEPQKVTRLREEADRLLGLEEGRLLRERGDVVASAPRLDRLDPVIDLSPVFAELANGPHLAAAARFLLGPDAQLMKDKFIAKPPGAKGYALHQDAAYWQKLELPLDGFVTFILCLDPMVPENGCVEVAEGGDWRLLTPVGEIADPAEDQVENFTFLAGDPGDLLAIGALTPHRSGVNRSASTRRGLFFSFAADPRPDLYERYAAVRATLS